MMRAGIGVYEQLERSLDRAVRFVLAHRSPDGRLIGGCAARALESALVLHLFRRVDYAPELHAGLAAFCRRALLEDPAELSHASQLDRRLSDVICELVLDGGLGPNGLTALARALTAFDHPTLWRKRVLIEAILAELGGVPACASPLSPTVVGAGSAHLWVSILLASIRVLQLCHLGRPHEVTEQEIAALVATQSINGSWEQHVLVTCVVLLALSRLGRASGAVALGLRFLASQLRPEGGVPFITNEDVWISCLGGMVLAEARVPAHELQPIEHYLVQLQQPDGGWAYAEGVTQTDSDDTSVALTLLARRNQALHLTPVRRAVANLLALQNADGGFPTFVRGAASDAEITAKAIVALQSSGIAPPDAIDSAWSWLAQAQQADGSFRGEWKLCVTYPALHVINAAVGQRPGSRAAQVRQRCVAFLRNLRRRDGGWPIHPDDRKSHLLSSAYALGGLSACPGSLTSRELYESIWALLAVQDPDGGFRASADSLGPRPFVYDVPILATIYSVWALARARDLFAGRANEVPFAIPARVPRVTAPVLLPPFAALG
jgi:hypothetical protein